MDTSASMDWTLALGCLGRRERAALESLVVSTRCVKSSWTSRSLVMLRSWMLQLDLAFFRPRFKLEGTTILTLWTPTCLRFRGFKHLGSIGTTSAGLWMA